jgi:hypothetical protein
LPIKRAGRFLERDDLDLSLDRARRRQLTELVCSVYGGSNELACNWLPFSRGIGAHGHWTCDHMLAELETKIKRRFLRTSVLYW